jgi:transcription antitermination factor NusG
MSKDKAKPKAKVQTIEQGARPIKYGDAVKITAGRLADKLGTVKHIRASSGIAHVYLHNGAGMVYVATSTLEAA